MPSKMDDLFDLEPGTERNLLEREERCQKTMRAVTKAIVMRLVICGILIWVIYTTVQQLWVTGMMLMVLLINAIGIGPLFAELKKRRAEWKLLLEEEE